MMRRIDGLNIEFPYAGARMLTLPLRREDIQQGCRHVRTLMKRRSIEALHRKPNTSRRNELHKIWPHLWRTTTINRASQVLAVDTRHILPARGFVYLSALAA